MQHSEKGVHLISAAQHDKSLPQRVDEKPHATDKIFGVCNQSIGSPFIRSAAVSQGEPGGADPLKDLGILLLPRLGNNRSFVSFQ